MAYNLGVIGLGHWFERLYEGMVKTNQLKLTKVVGTTGVDAKRERLASLKVPESNYYQVKGDQPLPDGFFQGLDIVHVSDPNEFHSEQTIQALSKGKVVLTEKSFGGSREEFEKVIDYVQKNNLQDKVYLHLHYAHKLLTMNLPDMLKRMTNSYGKIVSTSFTFFEPVHPNVDRRRLWLFQLKNGGIFMDLIHPFETYYKGALADSFELINMYPYLANPDYDKVDPTAVHARVKIGGTFFKAGATADIRVAIGLKIQHQKKCLRLLFDKGQCLDLEYLDSGSEYNTDSRGVWILRAGLDGDMIDAGAPKGPTPSDILVNDLLELCRGKNPGFTIAELNIIFGPQWIYQEMLKSTPLITDAAKINAFISDGLDNRMG
jgi:hypothetical protein